MISVKAHWEQWCRWNCDLRVINAWKKGILCCTESIAMTPKSCACYITLGSRCKLANSSSEDDSDTLPKRPTRIQPYQFEPVRQDFERVPEHRVSFDMRYSMGFAKSHSLKCSLHKWAWCGAARVSSFELYKLNPLSPHCGSIAWTLVHWYTWGHLRIVTVRGNIVGRHS